MSLLGQLKNRMAGDKKKLKGIVYFFKVEPLKWLLYFFSQYNQFFLIMSSLCSYIDSFFLPGLFVFDVKSEFWGSDNSSAVISLLLRASIE